MSCNLPNRARGEYGLAIGDKTIRLCVTLRALAQIEAHFNLDGFEALGQRMTTLSAADLLFVLKALSLDEIDLSQCDITLNQALKAIIETFEAIHAS